MNEVVMQVIRNECEKIENYPGFGEVKIIIANGVFQRIIPSPTITISDIDRQKGLCYKSK